MLKSGGWEAEIIDKCSSALNNFVELHYDKVCFFSTNPREISRAGNGRRAPYYMVPYGPQSSSKINFKRHLHDVLRRQKEEIEKLKNQDRNTEKVNMALYKGMVDNKFHIFCCERQGQNENMTF